ncbi:hypothetical protein N7499_004961 [Penicillium canescens]|uniref:Large ribosomal subunit protein mL53 n=1 Tax=Penicillium canescens TaxID=5083 RepID=A0AAD6I1M9_PENCN|nr:uncharacterized protein N7446_004542 [Penicillium canescens]KAJ6026857.1 hypothetical protein N7460_011674 [Penicillium canescens]KAJ6067505.1 hypothetical protein N7446_004542 [Penicillium canescens]KAJ6085332.1 hypothetical protein N7499_004961 [Penicillium canescens]
MCQVTCRKLIIPDSISLLTTTTSDTLLPNGCVAQSREETTVKKLPESNPTPSIQRHFLPLKPTTNTAKMTIPISTITTFRTAYNPFSRASRPCRLFLGMLRTPSTIPTSSPTHIDIQVKQLPRESTQSPTMTIGFKGGKELTLDVGKRGLKIGDVIEEVSRVGRALQREASLKG